MKSPLRVLLHLIITTACLAASSRGQSFSTPPPEIVSAWKLNGGNTLLIFRHDGIYFQVQDDSSSPGMERGTFTWDKLTNAFSATTLRDTNGTLGLSHPFGATTLTVAGNTLTYSVAGEASLMFSRVVNTASAIVGSWFIPGDPTTVTFLADGTYYSTEEEDDAPFGYDGMERGTYSWNPTTKVLTATPITDTNGDTGLSSLPAGFTADIVGNAMTVPDDDGEITVLRRITHLPTPLNADNDFEVDQFANYRQSSPAAPTLLPVPVTEDHPFWGEAYIEDTVPGTGGTLTIASQSARPFINDDGWGIETEYTSLSALNASTAFPNNANYVFARTGGSATLSYPAGGTFPPAPKITPTDTDDGTWTNGEYILGRKQTLIWTAHASYDPATLVTVLSVVDQETGGELLYESVIQGDITVYDLTGKLTPGASYDVQLEHVKIASTTTSGTGPFAGKLGYALYNSNTRFTMIAPEEAIAAPVISSHPASQLPANGSKVTLTVGINSADPTLAYQWFKNNEPIPGQTGNSLSIGSYSNATDGGSYKVEVSNEAGSDTSNLAIIGSATVEFVIAVKDIRHMQTGPSTVILDPTPVSPTNGGPFGFGAGVQGQNMASLPAPTVTPPPGTPQDPFYGTLFFDDADDELSWRYGPDANDWGDLTQAGIDARFPNGTYTIHVDGVSVPLSLTGDSYPNIPQMTLTGGSWINGKYAMDAADELTVTTNAFTGYGANVDGRIGLGINDSGIEYFRSSSPTTNFATYTVPANTLSPNEIATVDAEFSAIVDKSNAIPGAYCAALYERQLKLEVHILPKIITQTSGQVVQPNGSVNLQVSATGSPTTTGGSL